MKPNSFKVLNKCIEVGLDMGIMRYLKYTDFALPDEEIEKIKSAIENEILNEICDYFNFDNEADN